MGKERNSEGESFVVRTKIINSRYLTSECWPVQAWGLPHCIGCEYLATEECGGIRIRKEILRGKYPRSGLGSDTGSGGGV